MHLLFRGRAQVKVLENSKAIEKILREQSIKVILNQAHYLQAVTHTRSNNYFLDLWAINAKGLNSKGNILTRPSPQRRSSLL